MQVYWVEGNYIDEEDIAMLGWKARTQKMHRHPDLARVRYGDDIAEFLAKLQDLMAQTLENPEYELPICTEHKRGDLVFRGHPDYRGSGPWRDWAMINWGDPDDGGYGDLPCQIWCFVIIEGLSEPDDSDSDTEALRIKYGGIWLENQVFAVVESAGWDPDHREITMSDLFHPILKDIGRSKRRFYLANVDAIVSPMCVVPDIGCKGKNRYFQVEPRSQWVEQFVSWVEDPHEYDAMT